MTTTYDRAATTFTRGQQLRLAPHPEHCDDLADLVALCRRIRREAPGTLLAADLFSGAGGMSLGLEAAGMRVVFGADHDPDALETHAHHFGGMSVDWDLGDPETVIDGRRDPADRHGSTSSPADRRASRSRRPVARACDTWSGRDAETRTTGAVTCGDPSSRSSTSPDRGR